MLRVLRPTAPAGRIPLGPCSNTAPSGLLVELSQPPTRLLDSNKMTCKQRRAKTIKGQMIRHHSSLCCLWSGLFSHTDGERKHQPFRTSKRSTPNLSIQICKRWLCVCVRVIPLPWSPGGSCRGSTMLPSLRCPLQGRRLFSFAVAKKISNNQKTRPAQTSHLTLLHRIKS